MMETGLVMSFVVMLCCRPLQIHCLMLVRDFACRGASYDGPAGGDAVPADGAAKPVCAAGVPLHAPSGRCVRRGGQLQGLLRAEMPAWTVCWRLLRARLRLQASPRKCSCSPVDHE